MLRNCHYPSPGTIPVQALQRPGGRTRVSGLGGARGWADGTGGGAACREGSAPSLLVRNRSGDDSDCYSSVDVGTARTEECFPCCFRARVGTKK